ncbi:hypothetical protein AVEN_58145-1 [Araneus ventricosus]|uniref:Uncharacterized protein n=1 Tax=Araneus ventricosus TaxID=182803 RepID=A0A4Y2VGX9_ARAVE|nr:hypothetical protein AVEN_58145-1 [Araneus ventricosus]
MSQQVTSACKSSRHIPSVSPLLIQISREDSATLVLVFQIVIAVSNFVVKMVSKVSKTDVCCQSPSYPINFLPNHTFLCWEATFRVCNRIVLSGFGNLRAFAHTPTELFHNQKRIEGQEGDVLHFTGDLARTRK